MTHPRISKLRKQLRALETLKSVRYAHMIGVCVKPLKVMDNDTLVSSYSRSLGIVVAAELPSILER